MMDRKSFAWLFGFAAFLRILLIWNAPLWYDENFSLLITRLSWSRFWQAIEGDVHPPLYYLIIRPIALLNGTAWLIRIPSIAFSLAALYLAWKIFEKLEIPPVVEMGALILMTILPTQLWFAQEARMYALLEMLVMLSLYALLTKRWWLLGLSNLLLLYTQNYGLFYVAIFALIILLEHIATIEFPTRKINLNWGAVDAIAFPFFAWIPWLYVLMEQMKNIQGKYWISAVFESPASLLNLFPQLFFGASLTQGLLPFGWLLLFIALIGGLIYILEYRPSHWLIILLMALGPMVLAVVASLLWQPVELYRPLIGSTPFLYLLVCLPLDSLQIEFDNLEFYLDEFKRTELKAWLEEFENGRQQLNRTALFLSIFILPILISNLIGYYVYIPQLKGVEIPQALNYIRSHWQLGDLIVHTGDGSMVNILPYSEDLPQVRFIDCNSAIGSLSEETKQAIGLPQTNDISKFFIANNGRVWMFYQTTPLDPPCFAHELDALGPLPKPAFTIEDDDYITSNVYLLH